MNSDRFFERKPETNQPGTTQPTTTLCPTLLRFRIVTGIVTSVTVACL